MVLLAGTPLPDAPSPHPDYHATSSVIVATNPKLEASVPPFEPGDGDMHISVNGTRFETHKYLIKRFQGMKALLDKQQLEIDIQRNDISAEDFCEMFKVLYASIIAGPFTFASQTLVSTLRVATIYEYSALRDYCIQHLEALKLDAVKRIEIAHEFHLPEWEQPAYRDLGTRDEPITQEEAKIIGLGAFVTIAEMREKEQRRRGEATNVANGIQVDQYPVPASLAGEPSVPDDTASDRLQADAPHASHSCVQSPPHDQELETNDAVIRVDGDDGAKIGLLLAGVELKGLCGRKTKHGYVVEIPDCKCRFANKDRLEEPDRPCLISSCAISALKSIQVQQIAHASRISSLESTVNDLDTAVNNVWDYAHGL